MRDVVTRLQHAGFVLKVHSAALEAPAARQYERLARGRRSRQVRERPGWQGSVLLPGGLVRDGLMSGLN